VAARFILGNPIFIFTNSDWSVSWRHQTEALLCAVFLLATAFMFAIRSLIPVAAKDDTARPDKLSITSQAKAPFGDTRSTPFEFENSSTAFEFENGWDEGAVWDEGPAYDLSEPLR
jgi:hypothetical protein